MTTARLAGQQIGLLLAAAWRPLAGAAGVTSLLWGTAHVWSPAAAALVAGLGLVAAALTTPRRKR